jgi:hypothetical protein
MLHFRTPVKQLPSSWNSWANESTMSDRNLKRRWYEFSPEGMLSDCKHFIRFAALAQPSSFGRQRRFQFTLRGMLLVVGFSALSFGLIRLGLLSESLPGVICFFVGLNVFVATIGATIERLLYRGHRGTVGGLIASILVWGFVAIVVHAFSGIENLP